MAAPAGDAADAGLPRSLFVLGAPIAAVFLISFFVYLGFPYTQLGEFLARKVRGTGLEVTFTEIVPRLSLAGPGIEAHGVKVRTPDGKFMPLDRTLLRPAWSLSWLRGRPAVYAELEGPLGDAEGTVEIGSPLAAQGELRAVDVARLPFGPLANGAFEGKLDASIDVVLAETGPEGGVSFEAREGSLALPNVPMAVPYETLKGQITLGGDQTAKVESLNLVGPLVSADVSGTVGRAQRFEMSPLRLEAQVDAQQGIAQALQSAGLRMGRDGKARVRIQGTVSRPQMR